MTDLDAIAKRAAEAKDWPGGKDTIAIAADVEALLGRVREAEAELARVTAEAAVMRKALGWYAGLHIEVIRDCSGGMAEVPHRIMLWGKG